MSSSARSIQVFGLYLGIAGLSLAIFPNNLLPLLGLARTGDIWVRVVGLLTVILAYYFLNSLRSDDRAFWRATVAARLAFASGILAFVALRLGPPMLIAFAGIDLAGAAWTWSAIRAPGRKGTR